MRDLRSPQPPGSDRGKISQAEQGQDWLVFWLETSVKRPRGTNSDSGSSFVGSNLVRPSLEFGGPVQPISWPYVVPKKSHDIYMRRHVAPAFWPQSKAVHPAYLISQACLSSCHALDG